MAQNERLNKAAMSFDPYVDAVAINYGGGNQVLATTGRGLYISTAGNLVVVTMAGNTVTLTGLLVGTVYNIAVKQINQTGSTAAGLVLL